MDHPFTPGFGKRPPALVGREDLLASAAAAFAAGPSHDSFVRLMMGPRGVGKTTLLNEIELEAQATGWRVISVDANVRPRPEDSVLATIEEECLSHLEDISPEARRRITGINLGQIVGMSWENSAQRKRSLRQMLEMLVDASVDEGGAGVLITLDEFHNLNEEQASSLASSLQRITGRRQKWLAFIGTGLAQMKRGLLNRPGFTFFRRCDHNEITHLGLDDTMEAIARPLEDTGMSIGLRELGRSAAATRGLPYAIQSIGAHLWRASGGPPGRIFMPHVTAAVKLMEADVADKVVTPIWARLSPADKRFLFAMLPDSEGSTLASIAERLAKPAAHVHTYKSRLLDEGVITETPLGDLAFTNMAVRYRADQELALETMSVRESQRLSRLVPPPDDQEWLHQALRPAAPEACAAPMPRARATCVLPSGHKGSHRSKRSRRRGASG